MDKDKKNMTSGGGTVFIKSEKRFKGPSHVGIVNTDSFGEVITYHFYDSENDGLSELVARGLLWTENAWPKLGKYLISPNQRC